MNNVLCCLIILATVSSSCQKSCDGNVPKVSLDGCCRLPDENEIERTDGCVGRNAANASLVVLDVENGVAELRFRLDLCRKRKHHVMIYTEEINRTVCDRGERTSEMLTYRNLHTRFDYDVVKNEEAACGVCGQVIGQNFLTAVD